MHTIKQPQQRHLRSRLLQSRDTYNHRRVLHTLHPSLPSLQKLRCNISYIHIHYNEIMKIKKFHTGMLYQFVYKP